MLRNIAHYIVLIACEVGAASDCYAYTSNTPAAPIPPPIHIDTTPNPPPRLLSSSSRVTVSFVACAAERMAECDGSAVHVDLLLIDFQGANDGHALCGERLVDLDTARHLLARIPAIRSALGMASTGPMPMISGATPASANERKVASGFKPHCLRAFLAHKKTAAAPSLICEVLPAVTVPPTLNAGFSAAKAASEVSARTPSS